MGGVTTGQRQSRLNELAEFLRSRRAQTSRTELGLPDVGRRTAGLRREEVAFLSGVSVTWYTWLEQARDIRPSRQVLDAIARTLRLSVREHTYVLELAGYAAVEPEEFPHTREAPPHIHRLVDALSEYPSYAITSDWGISAWNRAYEALYPNVARVDKEQRNLLWLVFTDPAVRDLLGDWSGDSRHFLAQFRAEAGPRLGDPSFSGLVSRLIAESDLFAQLWDSHDIEPFTSRVRWFHHRVGDLKLEHHRLTPSGEQELHVVIYTPADQPSRQRLSKMIKLAKVSPTPR